MNTKLTGPATRRTVAALVALLATTLALVLLAGPARADTVTVRSTADPGDGACGQSNACTLREAIDSANSGDTIKFASNVTGTITLSGTQLEIDKDLKIEGPGTSELTISGDFSRNERVFYVNSGTQVEIRGLTISEARASGIINAGTLTLADSTVSNNRNESGFFPTGGGIRNSGTLEIANSTISGNSVRRNGGGIYNSGTLTLTNSTVSENSGQLIGGGIYSITTDASERTTIKNSTISGNSASYSGGGIHNDSGLTVVENATVTRNTAPSGRGGGVASFGDSETRTEVRSSIISANTGTDVDSPTNSFRSNGYNLIGGGNATGAFVRTGDRTGVSAPKLGALANNGGPTKTHAPLKGSPAIDKSNVCPAEKDQRGVIRPQDGDANGSKVCDIGAFELEADTTAPNTTITSGPSGSVKTNRATFRFRSSEVGSRFQCSLDGGRYATCASSKTYTRLSNKRHTLRVRAIDQAGNVDQTPAVRNWTVDRVKPSISRTSPRSGTATFNRTPTIRATIKDNRTNLKKGSIKLYVDGRRKTNFRYSTSTDRLSYTTGRLAYKRHSVKIVAEDAAGNTAAKSWRFTVKKKR